MSRPRTFVCDPATTDPVIRTALELIAEDFPIRTGRGRAANVELELRGDGPRIEGRDGRTPLSGATVPQVLRALAIQRGFASSRTTLSDVYEERPPFDSLGVMWDQSRNAVARPETVKYFLRRMALMGLNLFMLYTEDTYG